MSQYKNTPAGFVTFKKRVLLRTIPLILISIVAGLSIAFFSEKSQPTDLLTWIIIILFVVAVMTYAVIKSIKTQKEAYNSYSLTLGIDFLSRQQNNLPTITLFFNEITQITEDKFGNLLVKGQKSDQTIAIPEFIEDNNKIRSILQSLQPITKQSTKKILQKYPFIPAMLSLGCMAIVYLSHNKILVAVCGLGLITFMSWSFFKIRASKQKPDNVKSKAWLVVLVVASVIAVVYYKVWGS